MAERILKRVEIGPGTVRYSIRLLDDESVRGTQESMIRQYLFMQWLAGNYELLNCGPARFERLRIFHDGTRWVAEAEAEVEERTDQE